jgi:hypothetical protein
VPSLPGDYNRNNVVDAADYVLWRKTLGTSVTSYSAADGNGDGTITQSDYPVWRANFGQTAGAGTAAIVALASEVSEATGSIADAVVPRTTATVLTSPNVHSVAPQSPISRAPESFRSRLEKARVLVRGPNNVAATANDDGIVKWAETSEGQIPRFSGSEDELVFGTPPRHDTQDAITDCDSAFESLSLGAFY